jgi:putative transposase
VCRSSDTQSRAHGWCAGLLIDELRAVGRADIACCGSGIGRSPLAGDAEPEVTATVARKRAPTQGRAHGWCAGLLIDELRAVGRADIACCGSGIGRSPLAGDAEPEVTATVARKRAPTQSRAHGWCAGLLIDELRAVGRADIACCGSGIGRSPLAGDAESEATATVARKRAPTQSRAHGWCAGLLIDELGAVGRADIAYGRAGIGRSPLAGDAEPEVTAAVARKRAPTQSRAHGWCAGLSIDELRAVGRADIACCGSGIGRSPLAGDAEPEVTAAVARKRAPTQSRAHGWCAGLLIDELRAVGRADIACCGSGIGRSPLAGDAESEVTAAVARKRAPTQGRAHGWCAGLLIDELRAVGRADIACCGSGIGRSPLAGDAEPEVTATVARKRAPTQSRAHGRDLRKGRWSETGQIYLITTVTDRRRPVFRNFWCARLLIDELRAVDALDWSTTWAFVVMPDHLHWLVALKEADLSRLVLRVKSRSTIEINRFLGRSGRMWQKGYHDHAIRQEEDLRGVARYVVANPVRAGLVQSVRDYPHWDARWV